MSSVKVQLYQKVRGYAPMESGATVGAQVGVNLLGPDGKLVNWSQILNSSSLVPSGLNTTDDLGEGQWNLYFTNLRAQNAVAVILNPTANITFSYSAGASITANLTTLADMGGGALLRFVRDAWGRITGTSAAALADLSNVSSTAPTDTYVLTWVAATSKWTAMAGGGSPLTTKGDVFGFSTAAARVPVGADGTFLAADSTAPLGVSYKTPAGGSGSNLYVNTTAAGNVGTGVQNLMGYAVPGGTLATAGDILRARASFSAASTINAKSFQIKFGATTVFDSAGSIPVSAADDLVVDVEIIMVTGTTQLCNVLVTSGNTTFAASAKISASGETLSGSVALQCTGSATTTNDIVQKSLSVWKGVGGGGSSPLTTKGDLLGFSTVAARVPVGTDGQVLTADSTAAAGVSYKTPIGGVVTIVAGMGVAVDSTNAANPVVSSTLGSIALSGNPTNYAALPSGLGVGDAGKAYLLKSDGLVYIWSGTAFPASGAGILLTTGELPRTAARALILSTFFGSGEKGFYFDFSDKSKMLNYVGAATKLLDSIISIATQTASGDIATSVVPYPYLRYDNELNRIYARFESTYMSGTLANFSGNFDVNTSKTIIFLGRNDSSPNGTPFLLGSAANLQCFAIGGNNLFQYTDDITAATSRLYSMGVTCGIKNGSALALYYDSTLVASGTPSAANVTNSAYSIGKLISNYITGDIYSMILVNRIITPAELDIAIANM